MCMQKLKAKVTETECIIIIVYRKDALSAAGSIFENS